jgi:hypothetical protein
MSSLCIITDPRTKRVDKSYLELLVIAIGEPLQNQTGGLEVLESRTGQWLLVSDSLHNKT